MPLSATDAAHLIRRTGFGITAPLFNELRAATRRTAVERMVDPAFSADDAIGPTVGAGFITHHTDIELMQSWWLNRMVFTPAPLVEKLALFWHSHFVSSADKVEDVNILMAQNRLLRHGALGSFAELAQRVSTDPAMLIYLDNHTNVASAPQENFGRELLEVFTLGPAGRTEADVVAMTRAWTGHGLDRLYGKNHPGTTYQFRPEEHDNGPKQLFGLPPRNWDGPAALDELLFRSRAEPMSRFVTAKLFSFLAYPVSADDPVVHRLAAGFRSSKLNIQALVRSILVSDEFWSPAARGALVRSPVEWVVAALQATGLDPLLTQAHKEMPQMGQRLFHPPTVAGWGQNDYWLATARTWGKAALARRLAARSTVLGDLGDLPPESVATRGFQQFGILSPSPVTRRVVEDWVRRTRVEGNEKLLNRNLMVLLLLTPEFQLA